MNTLKTTLLTVAAVALAAPAALAEGGFKPNAPESFYAAETYQSGAQYRLDVVNWQYNHLYNLEQTSKSLMVETADGTTKKGLRVDQPGNPVLKTDSKNDIQ